MKLKATYNFLVLLLIYSFSCSCVFAIEGFWDTTLNMAVIFNNIWTSSLETVFLSLAVIACSYFNRSSDTEFTSPGLTTASLVFNTVWFVGLAIVVMINLSGFGKVLSSEIKIVPFSLGIIVNILAVIMYCTVFFTVDKYGTTNLYKTIVVIVSVIFSVSAITFAKLCNPVYAIQAVRKDGELHELLRVLEYEIKSDSDFKTDLSPWQQSDTLNVKSKISNAVLNGDITISAVDDTHVKIGWKRHIEPAELEKLPAKSAVLQSFSRWHDWGSFYKQTDKIIEMAEKIKRQKDKPNASKQ